MDSNSTPINLTDYSARMQIRSDYADNSNTLYITVSSSIDTDGTGLNLATHQKTLQIRFQDRIREQIEVFDVGQMESLLTDLHSFAKENNLKDLSGKLQIIGEFVEKFEIDLVIQKLQELHRIIDGKQA